MKTSRKSRIIACILRLIGFKYIITFIAKTKVPGSKKTFVPKNLYRQYKLHEFSTHKHQFVTFQHKEKVSDRHIIFLHGGAYLFEASGLHWKFAQKIVDRSYCRMTLIDYPLAPENNYQHTFQMVESAYAILLDKFPQDDFILMGDSAGAGLALAFSMKLATEKDLKQVKQNILFSPWLDLSLSNPDIADKEKDDHILSLKLLRYSASVYADGADPDQYLLSPINGDFNFCPPSIFFYGTNELFYPDCIKLQKMLSLNGHFIFREYKNMQHDWVIFPIPESDQVVNEISELLKK